MEEVVIGNGRASIAERIGKGGEGEVYKIHGRPNEAAKIYNANLRAKREGKVRAMVDERLATRTDLVAYPNEIVSDTRGSFLGFVMRLVADYRPLHELYSPKSRQNHFPEADYRFLIHAALNVTRAIAKVHQTGCVIGDLNHSGVLVAQNATVALIDADSFQFQLNSVSYPCVVGVPEFTPPELHGKDLTTVKRTIIHDNFGLAVAIFHLLFMGRHPYAGRYLGPDISMGEAIAQNRFAFSLARQATTQTTPPPGALTLDLFPNEIANAFENAFGVNPGGRPDASEWIGALTRLERSLSHCTRNKAHYYPSNRLDCVWCKLASASGFDMFPDLSAVMPNIPTDTRGTEQAILEILAFRLPTASDLLPQPTQKHGDSASLRDARDNKRKNMLVGALIISGAVAAFVFAPWFWLVWISLIIWGWSILSDREIAVGPFQQAYNEADQKVQQELQTFVQRNGLKEVVKVRSDLDAAISAYKGHDDALAHELTVLKAGREARQRNAYLDQFSIRRANIPGIGPAKTVALISFGIETAADINQSAVLVVPGFGQVMTGKLMDWRSKHEAQFRYNLTPNAQDVADEKALRARFAAEKAKLESTIRNGLGTLRNAKARLAALPVRIRSDRALIRALDERAQAEQNLTAIGAVVPASTVTFSIPPPPQRSAPPLRPRSGSVTNRGPVQPSRKTSTPPLCQRCGSLMQRRSGRYGQFWGCSRYPRCSGTRNI